MPFRARKKSKCHQERRNSPSVASFRPTSACFLMIFSISRSSTALSAAESISPLARLARASFSGALRSRLPTMSARNGGAVRWVIGDSLPDYRPRIANSDWRIGGDPPIPFATRYSLLAIRSSAPNLVGELNNHPQLGPLLVLGQHVAFFGGSEAALGRQAQLIERDIFGCLLDALLDVVARLEPRDDIKKRIEEATKYVALDQLCLSPQCGFASTEEGNVLAEDEQWAKLRMIVELAEEVWGK